MKKSEFISIRTTEEIKKKLEEIAQKEERSTSFIVNKILEKALLK